MKYRLWLPPLALFLFSSALLLYTLPDYGATWDEADPNLPAARRHAEWIGGLSTIPHPFSDATIQRYWQSTSDHPTLVRSLAALGILLLGNVCSEPTAARVPVALAFSVFLTVLYLWLARRHGSPWPALWGALALLLFPRVFAQAHFAAIDLPIAMMWVVMLWVFLWASGRGWREAVLAGLFYGLVLSTKLHAFFLPVVFLIHNSRYRRLDWRIYLAMALLGPLVYVAVQPLLWHHPLAVTLHRLWDASNKVKTAPIRLYYLGGTYGGNTPWHYPLVMTLVTFPLPILALLGVAAVDGYRRGSGARPRPEIALPRTAEEARVAAAVQQKLAEREERARPDWIFTFTVSAIVAYGLVLLPRAQAYDGLRLILPGVLSLVVLSSLGFARVCKWLMVQLAWLPPDYFSKLPAALLAAMLLPGVWSTAVLHPWQLSHYNLVGRAIGLERFETAYWCEGLNRSAVTDLNKRLRPGARVWIIASSEQQFEYYQQLGWLRPDVVHAEPPPPYDFHLMQVRQGMFGRTDWDLYWEGKRLAEYGPPGRPVFILFGSIQDAFGVTSQAPSR